MLYKLLEKPLYILTEAVKSKNKLLLKRTTKMKTNENEQTKGVKFVDYLELLFTGVVAVADQLRHSSDN